MSKKPIVSYKLPKQTATEIMDFVRRRVAKREAESVPELSPIKIYHLNRLFRQLSFMRPDEDLADLINKAMDEIESLEQREKLLLEEHKMLYDQLDKKDQYEV